MDGVVHNRACGLSGAGKVKRHGTPMKARIDKRLTEKGARKRYEIKFSREGEIDQEESDAMHELAVYEYEEYDKAMANFNIGIDCATEEDAQTVANAITSTEIYQQNVDIDEERVSLVSKQGLLDILEAFAIEEGLTLEVEAWPEELDYDEAEESNDLESFTYGGE